MKTVLTDKFIEDLSTLVAEGNSVKDACIMSGITEQAYYQWIEMADGRKKASPAMTAKCIKLHEAMKVARAKNKDFHIQAINKASRNGVWQASAWYLERVYRDEYGKSEKLEHTGKDGTPLIPQKLVVEIVDPKNDKQNTDSASVSGSPDSGTV